MASMAGLARLRTCELAAASSSCHTLELRQQRTVVQLSLSRCSQSRANGKISASRSILMAPSYSCSAKLASSQLASDCSGCQTPGTLPCSHVVAGSAKCNGRRSPHSPSALPSGRTCRPSARACPCGSSSSNNDIFVNYDLIGPRWHSRRQEGGHRRVRLRVSSDQAMSTSTTSATSTTLVEDSAAESMDGQDEALTNGDLRATLSQAVANAELADAPAEVAPAQQISQAMLIWRAVKLPIYTVALIPLTVGSAAAYLATGRFFSGRYWSFLFFSILVIAWLNLSNDAFDAETGVDKDKPESVVNMTGSRSTVLAAAFGCLVVGLAGICRGALAVGDPRVGVLLAAAIACGYVYQCPPFRLSYKGLGEPLCFLAFGPLATTAFYLFQASSPGRLAAVSGTVVAASILVGITTTLILFCSHFHQIEGDLAMGKLSPLVRLGTARGALVVRGAVLGLYALTAAFVSLGLLPLSCAVGALITVPIGRLVLNFVTSNHEDKTAIFMAKYFCVRLHTAFGLLLALSLSLGRWRPF